MKMKIIKKNQIIVYAIVLMLMVVGYLNYTSTTQEQSIETAIKMEATDDMQLAGIGDAKLVSSNDVITENTTNITNDTNVVNNENSINIDKETSIENQTVETNSNDKDEYFTKSKLERETMYSQIIESYEKILNSTNSLETQKQVATKEIQKINETKNSIMICENLIKTKGFENNIIFVNSESISVIIGVNEIKQEEIAQIQNIISREMKSQIENIHISTK